MKGRPIITAIEIHQFWHETADLGVDYNGFNTVYEPGARRCATRLTT